jgi:hypothetical protein
MRKPFPGEWLLSSPSLRMLEPGSEHLQGRLKFREIAKIQETSVKTALSRYRYGLDKLRSILNGEVTK